MTHRMAFVVVLLAGLVLAACGADTAPTTTPGAAPAAQATAPPAATTAATPAATARVASAAPAATPAPAGAAGTTTSTTTYPLTIMDSVGQPVTLAKRPERVVCLSIACPDILFDLGIAPVAVSSTTLYAEAAWGERAKSFAVISYMGSTPNIEDVARARPDLILASVADQRDSLNVVAPAFIVTYGRGVNGAVDDLTLMGKVLGRETEAAAAIARYRARVAAYRAKSPANLKVMLLSPASMPVNVYVDESITCGTLAEVTPCPWKAPAGVRGTWGIYPYSIERILADDPDVILLPSFEFDAAGYGPTAANQRRMLEANPLWKELKAVKAGRVYAVDRRIVEPYSTFMAQRMLDAVMPLVYPQVFPQPLP